MDDVHDIVADWIREASSDEEANSLGLELVERI